MQFSRLAQYFQDIEKTASRNSMTERLAELFASCDASEIDKICYLLQGRVVPLYEAVEFGVADKFMIRAIAQAYNTDQEEVTRVFKRTGDVGIAAETLYAGHASALRVVDVFDQLSKIAHTSGEGSQEEKINILASLLAAVDAVSARYIARIPLDKLRLGFSDMTMLDALSWMQAGDKSLRVRLEDAYNVRPDLGHIARALKTHGVGSLAHVDVRVGAPILAALCQRLPSANDMIKKMGEVCVEPKYDGTRVQIHVTPHEIRTYSRNLENTTAMFPELDHIRKELHAKTVILDAEAVGVDPQTGNFLPFQETMTRKRKHAIEEARSSVPLKFVVFDILYEDDKALLSQPLRVRRERLDAVVRPQTLLARSPYIVVDTARDIRQYHNEQLKKGLEGVVVKKWNSPYEPGRRGFSWVKFKEEEGSHGKLTDTIDAVIMGYSSGEGKRSGFGIGMFLVGVRKNDMFVTISKIGTGVSDQMWRDLKVLLDRVKTSAQPKEYADVHKLLMPDVWVEPKIVVEIAGDDLTKSPTHGAAVAVRFPRLVRIREDKSPSQATTVQEIQKMFQNQFA